MHNKENIDIMVYILLDNHHKCGSLY